jgi:hypothetical protein
VGISLPLPRRRPQSGTSIASILDIERPCSAACGRIRGDRTIAVAGTVNAAPPMGQRMRRSLRLCGRRAERNLAEVAQGLLEDLLRREALGQSDADPTHADADLRAEFQ